MFLYHFSDLELSVNANFPVGNFAKTVAQNPIAQKFEEEMENIRRNYTPTKPSRLNCIFAFDNATAEGFKTNRKFLYELDIPETLHPSIHNYEVGSFFSELLLKNNIQLILSEVTLMEDYWTCPDLYINSNGQILKFVKEYLIPVPVRINRVINWN
ncbi:hypothetical protein MYP_3305 [Sporocytophaga myxococcoides]|uniref:Uncharacterized protein n=1 Tax=Sporocytophaga myxococcoides TaxID=153721 RepID=A0A098LGG5_9BACT|nr:hypothetical protein [Sporocytophaga myxococcoides]GAL86076.1 hypothetical protein MYP_3305 [Sporocytophaga myxococcoides]